MIMNQHSIIEHVLEKAGNKNLINELTTRLSQSEITAFLLALSKEMANKNTPHDILSRYESSRFVKPSELNPIKVKQVELLMLEMAEASDFSPLLLSPASPLGSCSVIAKVDQNNVISATRGLELTADSTNMLAIYLANGIKKTKPLITQKVQFIYLQPAGLLADRCLRVMHLSLILACLLLSVPAKTPVLTALKKMRYPDR